MFNRLLNPQGRKKSDPVCTDSKDLETNMLAKYIYIMMSSLIRSRII